MADDQNKQDACDAVQKTLDKLEDFCAELEGMLDAAIRMEDKVKLTRLLADAHQERNDQQVLLATLKAESVEVSPLSQEVKDTLQHALEQLDAFLREDQAFQARLGFASAVIGLVKDHEQEIRGLIN